jgi:hypothetical protein
MVSVRQIQGKTVKRVEDQAIKSATDAIMIAIQLGLITLGAGMLLNFIVVGSWFHRAQQSGSVGLYFIEHTLGLDIPFVKATGGSSGDYANNQKTGATGKKVADIALQDAGGWFEKGKPAQCAFWVRHILEKAGVNVGVRKGSLGPGMADSFAGEELGQIIKDKSQLQPGDIVMFRNTYTGGPRSLDNITHVGIYVGDGKIVDRPTRSAPVQHRSINHFPDFWGALRPSAYATNDGVDGINMNALLAAIQSQESGGNPRAVNTRTGAMGLYQILPSNITGTGKGWDKECLRQDLTTSQFLSNAQLQHEITGCKMRQYAATHQSKSSSTEELVRRVASTWYSGNGDKWNNTRKQGPGGTEPSISEYTASIWRKYQSNL